MPEVKTTNKPAKFFGETLRIHWSLSHLVRMALGIRLPRLEAFH